MTSPLTFSNYLISKFKFEADFPNEAAPDFPEPADLSGQEAQNSDSPKNLYCCNENAPREPALLENDVFDGLSFFKVGEEDDRLEKVRFLNPQTMRSDGSTLCEDFSAFWIGKTTGEKSRKLLERFPNWQTNNLISIPVMFDTGKADLKGLILWVEPSLNVHLADLWPTILAAIFEDQDFANQFAAVDIYMCDVSKNKFNTTILTNGEGQEREWEKVSNFDSLSKIGMVSGDESLPTQTFFKDLGPACKRLFSNPPRSADTDPVKGLLPIPRSDSLATNLDVLVSGFSKISTAQDRFANITLNKFMNFHDKYDDGQVKMLIFCWFL